MKLGHLLSALTGAERFPSDLVLCNLADTKRRNCHLGNDLVDRDIATFDAIVRMHSDTARGDRSARVSGDEWLFLGADGQAFALAVLSDYALTQAYRAGWRGHATKDGEERNVVEVVATSIARSARFVGAVASARDDVESVAARLAEGIWQAPVDTFARLEELAPPASPRWQCVLHYPARAYYCPFCASVDFDWKDGDSSVYSGDGTCTTCRAEVSFTDAGALSIMPPPGT